MKDLFFFDKMLIPKIIVIFYWFSLVAVVLSGVGSMFEFDQGLTAKGFFMGILVIIFSAVLARIWCELLVVLFKMNEALQELRHR